MPELTEEELEAYNRTVEAESGQSGFAEAFLSGLTNDETARTRWLAERRFPDMVKEGKDPVDLYSLDEDGDIVFYDARKNKFVKEFEDSIFPWFLKDEIWGKVGPTAQFLSEVVPGAIGLSVGFAETRKPTGAAIRAMQYAASGGTASYAARAGLSAMLGGPPLDVEKASKDLLLSTLFAGVPIGLPYQAFPKQLQSLVSKFPGTDGRTALNDIINHGGKTVDDKIAYTKERWGVDLTRAEAEGTVSSVSQLQKYLQKRLASDKLWQHYHDRQEIMNRHVEGFFDELLSGKYVDDSLKNKLTGKASLDASLDVAEASKVYLDKIKKNLAEEVKPLYRDAYDLDVKIDVSDILAQVRKVTDPKSNVSDAKRAVYQKIEKALIDNRTKNPRDTTELLHLALKDDFNRLIASATKETDKSLKREITLLRNQISNRLKESNPLYKQVTQIFDETIGTTQTLERSLVGVLANAVEKGGNQAARLTQRMFKGNASTEEITELKNILQGTPEGAQAWQNLKGAWLRTQWDDAISGTTNPLGAPNKFLRSIGIGNVKQAFPRMNPSGNLTVNELKILAPEIAESKARGTKAKLLEAILEPDELKNFIDITDTMQTMNWIALQGSPDTQPFQSISKLLGFESAALSTKGKSFIYGLMNASGRTITGNLGKESIEVSARTQQDLYEDILIDALIDPNRSKELSQYFLKTNPWSFWATQTVARGGVEGLNEATTSVEERKALIKEEQQEYADKLLLEEFEKQQQEKENLQGSINNFQVPTVGGDIFTPNKTLPPQQMLSPTVLPNEDDREIALRQQMGIAGLV